MPLGISNSYFYIYLEKGTLGHTKARANTSPTSGTGIGRSSTDATFGAVKNMPTFFTAHIIPKSFF